MASLIAGPGAPPTGITTASTCICDAHTLPDGAIASGSNVLNNASGFYSAATDIGKTIVVNLAGITLSATTTGSNSGATTTIAVSALAAAIPAGTMYLRQSTNTDVIQVAAANSGATTVTLLGSQTLVHSYTSGATLTSIPAPLKTTITGVNSATQVTLNANAATTTTTGAPGEVVYGTNNLTALQASVNAAIAARTYWYIASSPNGEGYLYDGALTVPGQVDIRGAGCQDLFGSILNAAQSEAAVYYPALAPYLQGSVLIQAAPNTDGINDTALVQSGDKSGFGIRFAGKFLNTGHGMNNTPPALVGFSGFEGGWFGNGRSLKVYGHDGNHYGMVRTNPQYSSIYDLHTFGGGHRLDVSNSAINPYGNAKAYNATAYCMCAGTANALEYQTGSGSQMFNLEMEIGPCITMMGIAAGSTPLPAGAGGCAPSQYPYNVSNAASDGIVHVGPLFQQQQGGNGGSANTFQRTSSGNATFASFNAGNALNGTNISTAATQNVNGCEAIVGEVVDLCPTPAAGASATLQTSPNSGMSTPGTPDSCSAPAGSAAVAGTLSSSLTTGGPITALPVNALTLPVEVPALGTTISVALYDTVSGQSQIFQASAAAVGATSITVASRTPTFAFPLTTTQVLPAARRSLTGFVANGWWCKLTLTSAVWVSGTSRGYAAA